MSLPQSLLQPFLPGAAVRCRYTAAADRPWEQWIFQTLSFMSSPLQTRVEEKQTPPNPLGSSGLAACLLLSDPLWKPEAREAHPPPPGGHSPLLLIPSGSVSAHAPLSPTPGPGAQESVGPGEPGKSPSEASRPAPSTGLPQMAGELLGLRGLGCWLRWSGKVGSCRPWEGGAPGRSRASGPSGSARADTSAGQGDLEDPQHLLL